MHSQGITLVTLFTLCLSTGRAIPFADPNMDSSPFADGPILETREPHPLPEPRGAPKSPTPPTPPSPPQNQGCPKQLSVAQNLRTSGSPYCCIGSGSSQVCGPAGSTTCSSTMICCINTIGVSILPKPKDSTSKG